MLKSLDSKLEDVYANPAGSKVSIVAEDHAG
jgi:hypothetical protein